MKAYPLLILSILVAGCASNPTAMEPKPAPDFRRPFQNTLYVEFLGDSQSIGLVAYANNPKWKCTLCQPQLTSAQAINLIPQVLALKPNAVHILFGAYDLDYETGEPDDEFTDATQLIGNLQQILQPLEAAKIPAIVGNQPPCIDPTLYFGVDDDLYAVMDFNGDLKAASFGANRVSLVGRRAHDRLLRHWAGGQCVQRISEPERGRIRTHAALNRSSDR